MTKEEKSSIMRVASDIVRADSIIDLRELTFLDDIRKKYKITDEDERLSFNNTLAVAISTLQESDEDLREDFMQEMTNAIMSDSICSRQEAVLMLMLKYCFVEKRTDEANVYSLDLKDCTNFDDAQILYIEGNYNANANDDIKQHYRQIVNEFRLIGYNFVYLPKVAEHYASISEDQLNSLVRFLYPTMTDLQKSQINKQITTLTTSDFCREQIANKTGMGHLGNAAPSLMFKVGDSIVNNKTVCNFVVLKIKDDALETVQQFCNTFIDIYQPRLLNPICEEKNRFAYTGLYKQVFDTFMLRKSIRSSVAIDISRCEIRLPEAGITLDLSRREVVLYALLMLESKSGGLDFKKADNSSNLSSYDQRIEKMQEKYNLIYEQVTDEKGAIPNIGVRTNLQPMFSKIKKCIEKHKETLDRYEDYIAQRNFFGKYSLKISPELCKYYDYGTKSYRDFSESEFWRKLRAK